MFYLLIGCDLLMALIFILRLNTFPPQIPLFFSRAWGEDQLADSWMIILLPFLMNVIFFSNQAIYRKFFPGNDFVKKIFQHLNIFLCLGVSFIFIRIILLVT